MRTAVFLVLLGCSNSPAPHAPAARAANAIEVAGTVTDPSGAPVADAEVALTDAGVEQRTRTDARGHFAIATAPGSWGVSASRAPFTGAFLETAAYAHDTRDLAIHLAPATAGVTVRGRVRGERTPATYVRLYTVSEHSGDTWTAPLAADGTFAAVLPHATAIVVEAAGDAAGYTVVDGSAATATADFAVGHAAAPPAAAVAWLRDHAQQIAGADPSLPLDDLAAPIHALAAGARIVGLGEATHGTREYFQLKHRIIRDLVEREGVTLVLFEANEPECRAIDAYIHGADLDANALVGALDLWVWDTEEVLAMIDWLRAYNAAPGHAQVTFAGFDMQYATAALADLVTLPARLAFDPRYTPTALRDLVNLAQYAELELAPDDTLNTRARDREMAANVIATLDAAPAGTRAALWAHSMHVEHDAPYAMGSYLGAHYGAAYVPVGMVFDRGAFRARAGTLQRIQDVALPAPDETDIATAFARTNNPAFLVDLRALPASGPVADYFTLPRPTRETGWLFVDAAAMELARPLAARFAAALYVRDTTPSRPLHIAAQ